MHASPAVPGIAPRWGSVLVVALSLSIGWGIRGNYGHEWGAAFPGALAGMVAVLLSERRDWIRRIPLFAMFGAIGWAFGGSNSYMVVIAYTHSGDTASVLYGFACLFLLGFLWGAVGGTATALPAYLSRERLAQFFAPLALIFAVWWVEEILEARLIDSNPVFSRHSPIDWFDTNWISALLAIAVVALRSLVRRRIDWAERLILAMAAGWWAGFLLLTVALHLHLSPDRSDNWAGSIGMVAALAVFLWRHRLPGILLAGLIVGVVGGAGFATATLFKLVEIKSGIATNWHSILEQTYGLINGLGLGIAIECLRTRAPDMTDQKVSNPWMESAAVAFVLLLIPYINLRKNVSDWIGAHAIPPALYFLSTYGWFDLLALLAAIVFVLLLREHGRRRLPLVSPTWLGKGQMLVLLLLWIMVTGNFAKAIVAFAPQRIVTEGVITVNALLCTLLLLLWSRAERAPDPAPEPGYGRAARRTIQVGAALLLLTSFGGWAVVRALYGNTFAGYAGRHIRFGTHANRASE